MAAEIESSHGEKPVYRKMAEYKKKIALVEVLFANYLCAFKTSYPGNLYTKIRTTQSEKKTLSKHCNNCECCPCHSRVTLNVEIVVLNCRKCYQCLKGHKSLGLLFDGVL